ncbi:UNVERIFIED_CONTAM: hypothetical protein Sindi_0417700 [Sesamum indicum]
MDKRTTIEEHGVCMLFFVEKIENLQIGVENDKYIDLIFQPLPHSYDSFVINFNMNGLTKSIHELINMLVQFEATTKKSGLTIMFKKASTSKANDKGIGHWSRKRVKARPLLRVLQLPIWAKGKGRRL